MGSDQRSSDSSSRLPRSWGKPSQRVLVIAVGLVIALGVVASPALAHEDEEEGVEAFQFVRQAIALIVNTPDAHDAIADKIGDALVASDDDGVNIAVVEAAELALEGEDLHEARSLLELSIGADDHVGSGSEGDVSADEVAEQFLDPLNNSRDFSGGDWAVIVAAFVLVAGGAAVAWAMRTNDETTS